MSCKSTILLFIFFLFYSCTTTVFIDTSNLISVNAKKIDIADDLDLKTLHQSAAASLIYLRKLPPNQKFQYSKLEYTTAEVILSMELLQKIIETSDSKKTFINALKKKFLWWKSPGRKQDHRVLFTGYFEPQYIADTKPSKKYSVPAYAIPKDLKVLDLGKFRKNLKNHTLVYRLEKEKILPYYSRAEIMEKNVLKNKITPLVWFSDPVDLFFLQIQGSGLVKTPSGKKLRLGYAGSNGREYSSIGKILIKDKIIPKEKMSMDAIQNYLEKNPQAVKKLLYKNQSYVFFRLLDLNEGPYGSLEVALTAGRSLAVDYRLFPKAALVYIATNKPNCEEDPECKSHTALKRFMHIQDTGGAIRTFGRADIFWGRGELAQKTAGYMQHLGDLFVLVAKKKYLK